MVVVEMYLVVFSVITPAVLWVLFFEVVMLDCSQFPYVRNSVLKYTFYLKCMILMYLIRTLKVEPSNVFFHCSNRYTVTVHIPLSCCRYILENVGQLEAQFKRQPARYTLLHTIFYPYTLYCTSY